jgi:Glucose dehydrogenase
MDSLYTSSVLAIRPDTGEIACHYQYTPNDVYDVDGADEHVLADLQVNGQPRKVMIQPNKNGFLYVSIAPTASSSRRIPSSRSTGLRTSTSPRAALR